ncbi:MAG: hypothetical protein IKV96_00250 [Firmicutes bacterium]|nr:hypothetical protein [Bacillota bacterium]
MSDIRSEKRTDMFGDEYIVHYDRSGRQVGRSEQRKDMFGQTYTQHFDANGKTIGTSQERQGLFGTTFTQHFDSKGHITGTSEKRTDMFGWDYIQHSDNTGRITGISEQRTDILGQPYTQTTGTFGSTSGSRANSSSSSSGYSGSSGSYSSGYNSTSSSYSGSSTSYSGNSSGYTSTSSTGFKVSFGLGMAENIGVLIITAIVMWFASQPLYQMYTTKPTLFYQVIAVYATVSSMICLLILHKKHNSKGAGKIAIWLMALTNAAVIISETQLLSQLLYPDSIYHFSDFLRTIRFWIPLAIHGLILGIITALSRRKADDQKLYIRKVSAGFRTTTSLTTKDSSSLV